MDKKKIFIIAGSIITVIIGIIIFLLIGNKKAITYNISFKTDGGSFVESQVINEGDKVKKPVDPKKEGYMFVEWIYQGKTYDFSLGVTSDLILTAKWVELEEDVEQFIIKFETDGGTTISNQIIKQGSKVEKPTDPVKEGYIFQGWLLNNEIYDFETIVDNNIELKAKWEKIKEVNNNTTNNGGSSSNNNNNNNNANTNTNTNTNANTNNNTNNNNNNATNPTTPTVKKYIVTFNSNGGSSVVNQTIEEGSKVTKPQDPTKSGYTFVGWTLNGNNYDFNSAVKGNITLVAKWTQNPKTKYTVTFNSNGGSNVASQTVEDGGKATKPQDPTRSGYTFAGWTLNGNNYDFNSVVKGNITLVAKWTQNQKVYTIKATPKDSFSPDMILTVYEDGKQISVSEIKYMDGVTLCSGSNTAVSQSDIAGETNFLVVLTNGTTVKATLV